MGRTVLRRMEEKLVHTQGHAAAPGPAVAAAEATPADPADKLAAWLLSRVDLSDAG